MKVWELMAGLSHSTAGDDVVVELEGTLRTAAISFEYDDDSGNFVITGGDAELTDADSNSRWLSEIAAEGFAGDE